MGVSQSGFRASGCGVGCGWFCAVAWVGLCCGSVGAAAGIRAERTKLSAWDAAVEARAAFEAEPEKTHTRQEYAQVMDGFRAIYHADPGDAHAARAVAQVAELLAEQGREFGDKKSLHDAAGQYEYLAKAYPGGTMAPKALEEALALLGPQDADEARKVKAQLEGDYPRYVGGGVDVGAVAPIHHDVTVMNGAPTSISAGSRKVDPSSGHTAHTGMAQTADDTGASPLRPQQPSHSGKDHPVEAPVAAASGRDDTAEAVQEEPVRERVIPEVPEKEQTGPLSVVTGIRHWSTTSYTRVAIDLTADPGQDVRYQAARVENPDRIFFDLHHARLAQPLVGKSFMVTDDGFLTRIRAAQFSGDVTRVVLDVHQVGEYSAFLLPNPYRLIIDIHGKAGSRKQEVGSSEGVGPRRRVQDPESEEAAGTAGMPLGSGPAEVSSLPPMPVTDGSASFGLPARSSDTATTERVARPRVVISSKPTVAKPVPNTETKSSADMSTEVAAVSQQPGKVEATYRPTSQPISSGGSHPSKQRPPAEDTDREQGSGLRGKAPVQTSEVAAPTEGPVQTADGETSLTRALGLKIGRIVIDAGHGGHDSGTLGVGGIEEKDVVLDVALRLGKLLHDRLGAEIVYTRADDTFIPLETRTAIANKAQADLFISVHANSSQDDSARGVEVYYLNFTSDPEAMTVASRENAVSTESVHELSDLVKKIALKDKIDESRELASDVDASLYAGLRKGNAGLKDRGVKKAPFVVLIGANMPSILAEISFVTNPEDAAKLNTDAYRERVAESLYKGIAKYAEGINGGRPRVRTVEQAER